MTKKLDKLGVQVIDDFLPQDQFDALSGSLLNSDWPWYFQPVIVHGSTEKIGRETPQFTFMFFRAIEGWTDDVKHVVLPVVEKLNPFSLVRIKANLTVRSHGNFLSGHHIDFSRGKDLTTAIFYLNTTNGGTHFKDGGEVDCVRNRMVIFPSNLYHSGSFCTDQQKRVVINFNFIK
jgi:hypothetical protein